MSTTLTPPLDQQQQQQPPPLTEVTQQTYSAHSGHGSVGPFLAVFAVITILGVIAGMIGRLCSGRRILGHGQYDVESWVERKCSSCIGGHVEPAPTQPENIQVAEPVEERTQYIGEEEEQDQIQQHKSHASTSQS